MDDSIRVTDLETQLNDFDPAVRVAALAELSTRLAQEELAGAPAVVPRQGTGTSPQAVRGAADVVNMHCHTFFSFNAYGYSPSGLAWLAKRRGFAVMGIVDFDVLDGVDEFLDACDMIGVRGSAGLETRTFIPEFATREINSPGEPGIYYHMGIGFTSGRVPERAAGVLAHMRRLVDQRNQGIISRVNAYLDPIGIDYARDVLPLTPGGNPTERHIVVAYVRAVEQGVPDAAAFWAERLGIPTDTMADRMRDLAGFQNLIRAKLMKQGGAGYVPPTHAAFPTVAQVNEMTVACGALPCATWLDGTLEGEQAMDELLDLQISLGAAALNIVPDRNWNLADPDVRRTKVENLWQVVELAQRLALPLNVGTEMNAFGQKLVDDFEVPEMRPLHKPFLDGAYFVYGHTMLQRALGIGYQSDWAHTHLPERRARNEFYMRAGYGTPPGRAGVERLRHVGVTTPDRLLAALEG